MKWIFLLAVFAFLQYVEVKGYLQSKAEEDLHTGSIAHSGNRKKLIKRSIPYFKVYPTIEKTSHCQTEIDLTRIFDIIKDSLTHSKIDLSLYLTNFDIYIKKELEFLEKHYKQPAEKFLENLIEGLKKKKYSIVKLNSPLENTVSNNRKEENVVSTTPTNESTSTETASDNKTEENVVSTTPTNESTSTETASDNKTEENVVSTTSTNKSTNTETASDNKTDEKEEEEYYNEEYYNEEDKRITNIESMYTPYYTAWKDILKKKQHNQNEQK